MIRQRGWILERGSTAARAVRKPDWRVLLAAAGWLLLALAGCAATGPGTGPESAPPLDVHLPLPERAADQRYLGVPAATLHSIRLSRIKARIVVVEVFSMYCPYCHQEAPVVNDLYRRINGDPTIVDRIKLIGVGRGNTPFEVHKFREKYQIPFPLVADEDRLISNRWNIRRTPTFLAVALGRNQTPRLLFRHEGHIGDTASFLDRLRGLLDR